MSSPRFKAPQLIEVPFRNTDAHRPSVTSIILNRPVQIVGAFVNGVEATPEAVFFVDGAAGRDAIALVGRLRVRANAQTRPTTLYPERLTRPCYSRLDFIVQGVCRGVGYLMVIPLGPPASALSGP